MSTFRNPKLDYKGRVRLTRTHDPYSNSRIPGVPMRNPYQISLNRVLIKKIQKSKKNLKKIFFVRPASLRSGYLPNKDKNKQRRVNKNETKESKKNDQKNYEAGLAALAKYALAFVFTHAHTHKRKPYTLCPLWARVHFPAELRHSTPQGTRDARFPTPTEYH